MADSVREYKWISVSTPRAPLHRSCRLPSQPALSGAAAASPQRCSGPFTVLLSADAISAGATRCLQAAHQEQILALTRFTAFQIPFSVVYLSKKRK